MALRFNWCCCSVAPTKPYKKLHKKDHVALYQYAKQSADQDWEMQDDVKVGKKLH